MLLSRKLRDIVHMSINFGYYQMGNVNSCTISKTFVGFCHGMEKLPFFYSHKGTYVYRDILLCEYDVCVIVYTMK